MPTGACGVDCGACGLHARGICSTCGPGTSDHAARKLEAQRRLLGAPCPILDCAFTNRLEYCSRDCGLFPCENFRSGPYPFSEAYLKMQERRRKENPLTEKTPSGQEIKVPRQFWEDLRKRDPAVVCRDADASCRPGGGLLLRVLGREVLVDPKLDEIRTRGPSGWDPIRHPLMELLTLVYLLNVTSAVPDGSLAAPQELKESHFFQGPHTLKTEPVLRRFGYDPEGFRKAALELGGTEVDLADAAFRFLPFPKIPVYYLLWLGDEEFEPRISVLFDRSVEKHLSADALWGIVNFISDALLGAPRVARG